MRFSSSRRQDSPIQMRTSWASCSSARRKWTSLVATSLRPLSSASEVSDLMMAGWVSSAWSISST
ncbi:hypothetical protein [Rubritalea tangerina]|uniref:hypothetical protein n=1 Tax=Rubritalea tangerina TaxID=430798 RepID=UPI00361BB394